MPQFDFPAVEGQDWSAKRVSDGGAAVGVDAYLDDDGHSTWFVVIMGWFISYGAWLIARLGGLLYATSSTSLDIATVDGAGECTIDVGTGKAFGEGQFVTIHKFGDTTKKIYGQVSGYTDSGDGPLAVDVEFTTGSGTATSWVVRGSGPRGPQGAAGNVNLGDASPQAAGVAAAGASSNAARDDHVHPSTFASQAEQNAATSAVLSSTPATSAGASYLNVRNYVLNPEGQIFQEEVPAADNARAWDGWRILLGAANAATVATLTTGLPAGAKSAMQLIIGSGNNNKCGWFHVLEDVDAIALRGKTVCVQMQIQATAALADTRIALVEWTGTANATSGDPISAWGATGTVPTYIAGYANLNTPASLAVGTGFAEYSVTGTVGASANNLAIFIWTDATSSTQTTDKLAITMVQLSIAGAPTTYSPRPMAQELQLCQRRCQVIAQINQFGVNATRTIGSGLIHISSGSIFSVSAPLPTEMRVTPTVTISAPTHFAIRGGNCESLSSAGITEKTLSLDGGRTATPNVDTPVILRTSNDSARLTLFAGP